MPKLELTDSDSDADLKAGVPVRWLHGGVPDPIRP